MALPKLDVPVYELKLPSNGKLIKYRPWLVKEEKILHMAMESGDKTEIRNAIQQIARNCVVSEIDTDKLAVFDVEYLFLQLRSKAVSDTINVKIEGDSEATCKECKAERTLIIKIDDIKVQYDKEHTDRIQFTKNLMAKMRYPTFNQVFEIQKRKGNEADIAVDLVAACIEEIYDVHGKEYNVADEPLEQITELVEGLMRSEFKMLRSFLDTMPKIAHEVVHTCKTCKKETIYKFDGIADFFGFA